MFYIFYSSAVVTEVCTFEFNLFSFNLLFKTLFNFLLHFPDHDMPNCDEEHMEGANGQHDIK